MFEDYKNFKGVDLYEKITHIKVKLSLGIISYDEAKKQAIPIIDEMNRRGKEVAKAHKRKYTKISFSKLMR